MTPSAPAAPAVRRLLVVACALLLAVTGVAVSGGLSATGVSFPAPTPQAECGPGARPETDIQGRVPSADYESGRFRRGYRCNTRPVAREGKTGGFKVHRYTDRRGNTCAYYDSTLTFPKDVLMNAVEGLGVVVLDMNRPHRPRRTTTLTSPAMQSPHESLVLNRKRGLLAATLGNAYTNAGILDIYDVRSNCRKPRLLSSTPVAILGHESGWSPDGRTFYAASTGGQTFVAIDTSDPTAPVQLFRQFGVNYHGLRVSPDNRTLYVAEIGNPEGGRISSASLRILDVTEIHRRRPAPEVAEISTLTWREHSIAQVAEPFRKNGRDYLLHVDEFANYSLEAGVSQASAPVGAARIIDITRPERPKVISHLRLAVHQPGARKGDQQNDPGAEVPVQGYAAHYCSVPQRRSPRLVGCSMILSGLRLFDISNLRSPKEVGYFNKPVAQGSRRLNPLATGAYAMSQPAYDVRRRSVWYTDANSGFFVVRLTNGVGRLLRR